MPDIARFNEHGIWKHKNVFFSKYGNLKDTVVCLVQNSPSGLEASEIGSMIGLLPRSFMSHFRDLPELFRVKLQGRFIYFSCHNDIYVRQKQHREQLLLTKWTRELPADADAVLILVDRIKHPDSSLEQCALRLRKKRKHLRLETIYALLDYHRLLKKTPDISL
jgi:hypothetical protein